VSPEPAECKSKQGEAQCSIRRIGLVVFLAVCAFASAGLAGFDVCPWVFPAFCIAAVAALRLACGMRVTGLAALIVGFIITTCGAVTAHMIDPPSTPGIAVVLLAVFVGPVFGFVIWLFAEAVVQVIRPGAPRGASEGEEE